MMGERRDTLEVAGSGEIAAIVGLQQTYTGNTLCDTQQPVTLEDIRSPTR
jgi:elongation factor G